MNVLEIQTNLILVHRKNCTSIMNIKYMHSLNFTRLKQNNQNPNKNMNDVNAYCIIETEISFAIYGCC